jgi:hypothetical protein
VCKIRLQAQFHSMADPVQLANRKYKVMFSSFYINFCASQFQGLGCRRGRSLDDMGAGVAVK